MKAERFLYFVGLLMPAHTLQGKHVNCYTKYQSILGYKDQSRSGGEFLFWAYGIGQLINGYIGDRISGRIFIFFGLVSALINIFFGLAPTLVVMVILWMFNGYFQSMLWGPIVRILSRWFHREENTRVSVGISTSMVGGFLYPGGCWGKCCPMPVGHGSF